MSKGLEALERLKMFPIYQEIKRIPQQFRDKESINTDLSIIEKELKALEIIKKKVLVIPFLILHLSLNDLNGYNKEMDKKHKLTQEEYDLLKEVLL